MKTQSVFLLQYLGILCLGTVYGALQNGSCQASGDVTQQSCAIRPNPTTDFLTCVGVPLGSRSGQQEILHLKGLAEAILDIYSLLNSSALPLLDLFAEARVSPSALLQRDDVITLWMEGRLSLLFSTLPQNFLTCLGNANFSCHTYQTVVRKLSHHFSGLEPVQQEQIYSIFMYPFLSRNATAGCVLPGDSTEDWLMKNFGSFSVLARFRDFTSMNMIFNGLEVLHLLSPEQKAELLLYPEVARLDNTSLSLVFESLLASMGSQREPVMSAPNGSLWGPVLPPPFGLSQNNPLLQAVSGFMTAFRPAGSFARELVSLTHQPDLRSLNSATLVQALLNWTLAELAAPFKVNATDTPPLGPDLFDPTDINDWFTHVVLPVLNRFLPKDIPSDLTAVFHNLFYLENRMSGTNETVDSCSVTIEATCPMTNFVEYVANVLECAVSVNLTLNEETLTDLTLHLSESLNTLLNQLAMTNYSSLDSPFSHILDSIYKPSPDNLQDALFVHTWFQIKLKPMLSTLTPEYLLCLSSKPFSCQTFQILVKEMSSNMILLSDESARIIYNDFIFPFLSRQNSTGACMTNSSLSWTLLNLGGFSGFATVQDMYLLNSEFNALQAVEVFTPMQNAEIIVKDLPGLTDKTLVIDTVFNYILMSPAERLLQDVLFDIIALAGQVGMECSSYQEIMKELNGTPVTQEIQGIVQITIEQFIVMAPSGCVLPAPTTCFSVNANKTITCAGVSNTGSVNISCTTGLEQIACSQHPVFPVAQLSQFLHCKLMSNITYSRELWMLFLLEVSSGLDKALSLLSGMDMGSNGAQAANLLDSIGQVRLDTFSREDLSDNSMISQWFSGRLQRLLPYASTTFLTCIGSRNFSCQTFQTIVQVFSAVSSDMDQFQQEAVVNRFILQFLFRNKIVTHSACVMNNSVQWLLTNFGQFSPLISLQTLVNLNPLFNPLSSLPYLSPRQLSDVILLDVPGLPDREEVIRVVLDFLTDPIWQDRLPDVLQSLPEATNISCSSYRTILEWLGHLYPDVPVDLDVLVVRSKFAMLQNVPPGCVLYGSQCTRVHVNETTLCQGIDSVALTTCLSQPHSSSQLCSFSVTQYACAELSHLSPEDLVRVLTCYLHGNNIVSDETWKLFITKVNPVLDLALDLFPNTTLPLSRTLVAVLDMIGEVTLNTFSSSNYRNTSFIQRWFQIRLRPFLPYASSYFLSCLASKNFSCETYQSMIKGFSQLYSAMPRTTQISIYVDFIQGFLSLRQPSACASGVLSSDWLEANFGPFFIFASVTDLLRLNPAFSLLDTLDRLTLDQIVQVLSSPGLLSSPAQVNLLLEKVPDSMFSQFFFTLSKTLTSQGELLPPPVQAVLLQQVFARANLSSPLVTDAQVQLWLNTSLPPLITGLSAPLVPQYFSTVLNRPCPLLQQAVMLLNTNNSTFSDDTRQVIYDQIIVSLSEPQPLRCYSNQSYISFLKSSFMSFQFPDLSTFLSLIPPNRMTQLLASVSPAQLSSYLNSPETVDDPQKLCKLLYSYPRTTEYLQKEPVQSPVLARQTLACVWPLALSASSQADVDQWFNVNLVQYLPYLNSKIMTPELLNSSSCLAFRKFVSLMKAYNFSSADFSAQNIYHIIQIYLTTSASPRCYEPSDPVLNSTAWFVNYIGAFVTFLTEDDLVMFGDVQLLPFTVDPLNLQLFGSNGISPSVISYYTDLLYQANPSFSAALLSPELRCVAPASGFTALSSKDAAAVIQSLHQFCTDINPEVTAALVQSLGSVTTTSILALGNYSTGMSTGQLTSMSPDVLLSSISVLGTVTGWSQSQTMAIIQSLISRGSLTINSADSLLQLGTLVSGLPTVVITRLTPDQVLKAVHTDTFLANIMAAPAVVQEAIVNQIILVNFSSDSIVANVPNTMATLIPRVSLLNLSQLSVTTLNQKQWKYEQADLLFDLVANGIADPNSISLQLLQGFTCSRAQNYDDVKVLNLIKACRRHGSTKIVLQESQLTCMYNYIKNYKLNAFTDYPSDVLLYYDYSLIGPSICQDYFSALGVADFSVFSMTLAFKRQQLFNNARQCLGISGFNITRNQLSVLGNMVCFLNGSYIQNSDLYVLEKLMSCPGLSADQSRVVEDILLTGNTIYGAPTTWNVTTLTNLGIVPLYLTSNIWAQITKNDKVQFFRTFMPRLRRGSESMLISNMLTEAALISRPPSKRTSRVKRDTACTMDQITQVQAFDDSFPFGYDAAQFNACLSVQVLKDNLAEIAQKAVGSSYQRVILDKLNQVYPAGISDEVLQMLGFASRAATSDDISRWSVTKVDTLSALMNSTYGPWTPSQVKAIIQKYLSSTGKSLSSSELNTIGGVNLCALDTSLLRNITYTSLQSAGALSLSNCSLEQQQTLFRIAQVAFSDTTLYTRTKASSSISYNSYSLTHSFLGGASLVYVQTLARSNISMDLNTFTALDQNVINALSVSEVVSLLGRNLVDLKTYEDAPAVRRWVARQLQSDLDTLNLNITGGRASPTTVPANNSTAAQTTATTINVVSSTPKPTGSGSSLLTLPSLQQLLLLAVTMVTLQLINYSPDRIMSLSEV